MQAGDTFELFEFLQMENEKYINLFSQDFLFCWQQHFSDKKLCKKFKNRGSSACSTRR